MCSERSSLVNLGCKRQLSQEARRSVQLSQLRAKVQRAAENLGFTLQDVAVAGSVAVAGFPRSTYITLEIPVTLSNCRKKMSREADLKT